MSGRANRCLPVCMLLGVSVWAGCATTLDSRTGGVDFELQVRGEENFAVYYRVGEDGTLGFGGGELAFKREPSWTGLMTDAEIAGLTGLLETHGWFEHAPAATNEPPDHVSKIWLRWPRGFKRYTVKGKSPDVTPIEEHLERIARRRVESFLESLPEGRPLPADSGDNDE